MEKTRLIFNAWVERFTFKFISPSLPRVGLAVFAFMLTALTSYSQTTYDWLSSAPDGNWKQGAGGARWNPGGLWDEPPGTQILRFDNNRYVSMNNNVTSYNVHQIVFGSSATTARTLAGNAITMSDFGGADPKVENSSSTGHTVSFNITGDSDDPLELNAVSGDLTFSGNINNNGSVLNLYGAADKLLTLSGVMSGSGGLEVRPGAGGYHKVKISGASTYSGTSLITRGELWIDEGGTINGASAGAVTVGNATYATSVAKFYIGDSDGGTTVNETFTIKTGTGAETRIIGGFSTSGLNTFSGTVTLEDEVALDTVTAGATNEFSGIISGSHSVVKIGAGAVKLTAQNTFGDNDTLYINNGTLEISPSSGTDPLDVQNINFGNNIGNNVVLKLSGSQNFTIDAHSGTLTIADSIGGTKTIFNAAGNNTIAKTVAVSLNTTVNVASGTTLTLSGVISGSSSLTQSTGTGTMLLSSASSTITGGLTVNAGTLRITGDVDTGSGVTVGASGTLQGTGNVPLIGATGTIDPGDGTADDIATLTAEGVDLEAGGTLIVDFGNVAGTAGTDWDLLDASASSGNIENNVAGGTDVTIELRDTNISGFSDASSYTWKIMDGSAAVTDFSAADFTVDSTDWPAFTGTFSVQQNVNAIELVYTPAAAATITVSAGTLAFGDVYQNATSSELTYTVEGSGLSANITNTAPTGFEISTTSGSGFGATVVLSESSGSVASTTIYVRFNPATVSSFSANISHASPGAVTQDKAVTGTGRARPTDVTWDGGGANGDWKVDANWAASTYGDAYPDAGSSTILRFDGTTQPKVTNTYTAGSAFGSIIFNTGSSPFVLSGNDFVLHSIIQNNDNSNQTIENNITLGAGASFDADTGDVTVSGTVANSGNRVTALGGSTVTFSSGISGTGDLLKQEAGTLELTADNSFSGPSYLVAGNTVVSSADPFDGAVNLGETSGSDAATLTIDSASSIIDTTVTIRDGSSGVKTIAATESGAISGSLVISELDPGVVTMDVSTTKTLDMDGVVSGTGGGEIIKAGDGTVEFNNVSNSHDKKVVINAGTVKVGDDGALGLEPGGYYAGKITLNGGELLATNTFTMQDYYGTSLSAGGGTISVNSGKTLTYSPLIEGTGDLIKDGSGNLALYPASDSTYTGDTIVESGVVRFEEDRAFGAVPGAADANSIQLNGGTIYLYSGAASAVTLESNRGVTLGAGGGDIQVWSGKTLTYGGVITGSTDLTKQGAGRLVLSGANDYTGGTTVNTGTLQGDTTSLQGGISVASGDDLVFDQSTDGTYAGAISSSGDVTKDGTGNVTWSGANTHSGSTVISNGTLTVSGSVSASEITVESGASLAGAGTVANVVVDGDIAPGNGGIGELTTTDLTMNNGAKLLIQLGDYTDNTDRDFVDMNGSATVSATTTIELDSTLVSNFDSNSSETWVIIEGLASTANLTLDATTSWTDSGGTALNGGAFTIAPSGGNIELTFTPLAEPPTLVSPTHTAIDATTATLGATVQINGGDTITDYGVVWNTSTAPTTGDNKVQKGTSVVSIPETFTVSATTLPDGTLIYYRGYGVNVNGTGYSAEDTFYTLSTEPTAQVTGFTADDYTGTVETQLGLSWDAVASADGYIILRSEAATPDGVPDDATNYVDGATLGNGVVETTISSGATTSYSDTGLTEDTHYYYKIIPFGYDGSNYQTYNYKTDGTPGTDDSWTLADPATTGPTLGAFSSVGPGVFTVNWTLGADSDRTLVVISAGSGITNPSNRNEYTPDANFGDGDTTGADDFVVYAGSGASVAVTGLEPGTTYYVELTPITGDETSSGLSYQYYTAGQATGSQFTTAITDPTPSTPTADGEQAVDLSWALNGSSDDVLVVRYVGGSPSETEPTGALSAGSTVGDGLVVYFGGATSFKDVHLTNNTTYTYFYYSEVTENYSDGVSESLTTADAFKADEISDAFSYTLGNAVTGANGGTGFSGAWTTGTQFSNVVDSFTAFTGEAAPHGHRLLATPADVTTVTASRGITAVDCGQIFVSFKVRYEFGEAGGGGNGKFVGLSLMDGATEEVFFGEGNTLDAALTIDPQGDGSTVENGANSMVAATDYLLIGKYDFRTKVASLIAYTGGSIPSVEPSFTITTTLSTGPAEIDGIQLSAGATVSGNPGNSYFDEVRIGKTWGDLLTYSPPRTTAATVDDDNSVTDGALADGVFPVVIELQSPDSTIDTDGTPFAPNFDLLAPTLGEVLANEVFATFDGVNTVTNTSDSAHIVSYANIELGIHTVRVSAASSDGSQTIDEGYRIDDCSANTFTVIDDDTVDPIRDNNAGTVASVARSMVVMLGSTVVSDGAGTASNDRRYDITDGDLAGVDGATPLRLVFSAYDADTGLSRGITDATTQMNVDLGTWTTDNVTNYVDAESTTFANTTLDTATSTWKWVDFDATAIGSLYTGSSSEHTISVTLFDADNDRASDREALINEQFGLLRVEDDDDTAPSIVTIHSPDLATLRNLHVLTNGVQVGTVSGSGTSVQYSLTDGDLVAVSSGNKLSLYLGAVDADSGLSRGTTDAAYQSNLDIGDTIENNVAQYDSSLSSGDAETSTTTATNVWRFESFTTGQIADLFTDSPNAITLTWFDDDTDRGDTDRSSLVDQQHGLIAVTDDDSAVPTYGALVVNGGADVTDAEILAGGYTIATTIQDEDSGINVNGSVVTGTDYSPNYDILNNANAEIVVNDLFTTAPSDGGATTAEALSDSAPAPGTGVGASSSIDLGTYEIQFSVTDNDEDRGEADRESLLNVSIGSFTVIDDDADAPTITGVTFVSSITEDLPVVVTAQFADATGDVDEGTTLLYYGYSGSFDDFNVVETSGSGDGEYTFTIPAQVGQSGTTLKFSLVAFDNDADRTGDALGVTNNNSGAYFSISIDAAQVIYEPFTGTAGTTLAGSSGTGWTNDWVASSAETYQSGSFSQIDGGRVTAGGKSRIDTTVDDSDHYSTRNFAAFTTGQVYVAWYMNFDNAGDNKYAGVSLFSGATQEAFGGKVAVSGSSSHLGLSDGTTPIASSAQINAGSGEDYFYVMKYDYVTQELSINFYDVTNEIVAEEPAGYWNVSTNLGPGAVGPIDGVRISSGATGSGNIGNSYFDEIRVGTNWNEVVRIGGQEQQIPTSPTAELIFVGPSYTPGVSADNTTVTDGELVNTLDKLDFAIRWTANATAGMFITNDVSGNNTIAQIGSRDGRVIPNWDPLSIDGGTSTPLGLDSIFTGFEGDNGSLVVTTYVENAFNIENTDVDATYFISVSGENNGTSGGATATDPDSNGNDVPLTRGLTINSNLPFTVVDDDSVPPAMFSTKVETIGVLLNDDFEDGDLAGWTEGTSGDWTNVTNSVISGSYSLKHNLSGVEDESFITAATSYSLDNGTVTWTFQVQNGDWTPSSGNDWEIYLMASEANLAGATVDGYAVHVDGNVDLRRITDGSPVGSAIVDSGISWGVEDVMGIQVTRQTNGTWELFVDSNGGFDNLVSAGTSVDTAYTDASFFGVFFDFTSTRAGELWVDDIQISQTGPITDGDLLAGVTFANNVSDFSGIYGVDESGASAPTVTVYNAAGTTIAGAKFGTGFNNGGATALDTLSQSVSLSSGDIVIDNVYTAVVVVADYDVDRTGDSRSSTQEIVFIASDDDVVAPTSTVLTVNNGDDLTDADITNGLWGFTLTTSDADTGLSQGDGSTSGTDWSAHYNVLNAAAAPIISDTVFDNAQTLSEVAAASVDLTEAAAPLVSYSANNVDLGEYTIEVSVLDNDADRGDVDRSSTVDFAVPTTFTVVDDDTKGPVMGLVQVNSGEVTSLLNTQFEDPPWPSFLSADNGWTQMVNGATWISGGAYKNETKAFSGNGKVGFNSDGDWIQLPPVDSPGGVSFYASLSSAGAGSLRIDKRDGASWTTLSSVLTVDNNIYEHYFFDLGDPDGVTTLRVYAVSAGTPNPSIYIDNLEVHSQQLWSTQQNVAVTWDAATDNSGLAHYRHVAFGGSEPAAIGDGTEVATSVTGVTYMGVAEGVVTGFVFGVDADEDRGTQDRAKGANRSFIAKIDRTAPPQAENIVSSLGPDDTSEIQLTWSPIPDAGNRSGDDEPLSPWSTYRVYYSDDGDAATTSDPYISATNGPATLNTNATTTAILSNFVFGSSYRLAITGLDEAGNEGVISTSSVEISLSQFVVTQGVTEVRSIVTNATHLAWTAATDGDGNVNRPYDVLYVDSLDFTDSLSSEWAKIQTVTNSFIVDEGQGSGVNPTTLTDKMRFYRVALKDRWLPELAKRTASEQVYVLRNIQLYPGQNWVSFPGNADTNTASFMFGHDLPAGSGIIDATTISWFERDTTPSATTQIYLKDEGSSNQWFYSIGGTGNADGALIPVEAGCAIEIPNGEATQVLQFIGRVPTNTISQQLPANGSYSLIGHNQPRRLHPNQLGLREGQAGGFTGGKFPTFSDRIWKFNRSSQAVPATIWFDTDDSTWKFTSSGYGPVPANYFSPDDAIVVWTRKTTSTITLTNEVLYTPPVKEMTP